MQKIENRNRLIFFVGILYTLTVFGWLVVSLRPKAFKPLIGNHSVVGLQGTPLGFGSYLLAKRPFASNIVSCSIYISLLFLAQWAFLRPHAGWTFQLTRKSRPLRSAVISAAAMIMLLIVGFIALLLELPHWWHLLLDDRWGILTIWISMLLIWYLCMRAIFKYWHQGDRYLQLTALLRAIVVVGLLEIVVAVPTHFWAVQEYKNYSARGSYTSLVFSGTVLLWAFGPGAVLLYVRQRYRHARSCPECQQCGYVLRALPLSTTRCPECGYPFDSIKVARANPIYPSRPSHGNVSSVP